MQTIEKWRLLARLQFAPRCIFSDSPCIFVKCREFLPETGSRATGSSAMHLPDMTPYFQFSQSPELSRYFRALALRRMHQRQSETPNAWVWGGKPAAKEHFAMSTAMDVVQLSRLQFGLTALYHF